MFPNHTVEALLSENDLLSLVGSTEPVKRAARLHHLLSLNTIYPSLWGTMRSRPDCFALYVQLSRPKRTSEILLGQGVVVGLMLRDVAAQGAVSELSR